MENITLQTWANFFTIISGAIAFFAYLNERLQRKNDKRLEKIRIWSSIMIVKGIIYDISKAIEKDPFNEACHQAYGALEDLLKNLYKDAISQEHEFSIQTIKRWRKVGKLSSDWHERIALNLLDKIDTDQDYNDLPEEFMEWDRLDNNHPCRLPNSDVSTGHHSE